MGSYLTPGDQYDFLVALLVTYDGRPVRDHRRTDDGRVRVKFRPATPGQEGEVIHVSQADWQSRSAKQVVEGKTRSDFRPRS